MPGVDAFVLLELLLVILVVRSLMMAAPDAVEEGKVPAADGIAEHEGADPRRIGPESHHHKVEHQTHLLRVVGAALANPGRVAVNVDAVPQFLDGLTRQWIAEHVVLLAPGVELNTLLDGPDRVEVLVEFLLISLAELALKPFGVFKHEIDDAPVARR